MVDGTTTCRRLAPGHAFELSEHPTSSLEGEYVVTYVRHRGQQPYRGRTNEDVTYEAAFRGVAAAIAVRPSRRPRRLQQVVETAIVTGPPGEEIHVDAMGRIKIQFHWDRLDHGDDRSSCWVRVVQPWAGNAWGSQFIPRVGMEVLVGFVAGDVDRPVVIGSLYNGARPVPFGLPDRKTQSGIRTVSTPGGHGSNILRFDDAAGEEQIYVHAEGTLDEEVRRDHTLTVGGNYTKAVQGNAVTAIEQNHVLHVSGRQLIQIDGGEAKRQPDEAERAAPPSGSAPVDELHEELIERATVQDASLLLHAANLPSDARVFGDALAATHRAHRNGLEVVRDEVMLLRNSAARAHQQALLPQAQGRAIDVRTVHAVTAGARRLEARLQAMRHKVVASLEQSRPEGAHLTAVKRAFVAALRCTLSEVSHLEQLLGDSVAQTQSLLDSATARFAGGGTGGGGMITALEDVDEMRFLAPPRPGAPKYDREYDSVKGGSRMEIKGGGEINSPDGFRIASAGCFLELHDGVITMHGVMVSIQASEVEVLGGTVDINGGTVNIIGKPINLN